MAGQHIAKNAKKIIAGKHGKYSKKDSRSPDSNIKKSVSINLFGRSA